MSSFLKNPHLLRYPPPATRCGVLQRTPHSGQRGKALHLGVFQETAGHFLLGILLLLIGSAGWAAPLTKAKTYTPESSAEVTLPESTVKAEIERRRKRVRLFTVGERKRLAAGRADKAIGLTKDLYEKTTDPELKYKLSLKLAKLYFDQSQLQMVIAEESYEKKLKAYLASGPPAGSKPPPPPSHEKSRAHEDQAIEVLSQFVNVPGRQGIDEALYFLGLIYANRGEFSTARPHYQRILDEYPQSDFRWESKLMVAEGFFDDAQFQSALKLYNEVITENGTEPYPRYKKAWVLFNLKRFDDCIQLFVALFREGQPSTASPAHKEIAQQIIGDMVLIYTDALKVKEGIAFYDALAPKPASYEQLHKMAKALNENGFYVQARQVAKHLFETYMTAPIIPLVIATYLETFKEFVHDVAKYHTTLVTELDNKLKQFPPLQRAKDDPKMVDTYLELERFVVKQAKNLHADAQKFQKQIEVDKTKKDKRAIEATRVRYESALRYYDVYDSYFTSWPHAKFALEMAFYHGELEFERGNYAKAAQAYVLSLRLRAKAASEKEKKFMTEAMYGAVVSYDKVLGTKEEKGARAKDEDFSKLKPMSGDASHFLQAASLYLQDMKTHEAYTQILYRTAKVYYDHNAFQRAVPIFWQVIQKNPKDRLARLSGDLILDSYNALKDYAGLVQAGQQLLAIPDLATAPFQKETQQLMSQAKFKSVEQLETKQDFAAAADAYMKLAPEGKTGELGELALNNAAVNYLKANRWPEAMQAYGALIKRFPKSKFRRDAMLTAAEYHQLMGNFKDSQKLYKQFTTDYPEKTPMLHDVVYQIAFVAQTLGNGVEAREYYQRYLKQNPQAKDREDVIVRLCQVAATQGSEALAAIQKSYASQAGTATQVKCAFEAIKIQLSRNQSVEGALGGIKANLKKHIPAHDRELLAPFLIRKVDVLKKQYEVKRLVNTASEQSAPLLKQKLKLLDKMDALVQEISAYGVVSAVFEASKTLSLTYVDLSDDIMGSPLPKGLSEDDAQIYREQITKIAQPLRQKGLAGMKTLLEQAGELHVADPALASIWRQYDSLAGSRGLMPDWLGDIELMPFYLPTSKGRVRVKSFYDPVAFEKFDLARGAMALPDLSSADEKTKAYYEVLSLAARGDFAQAWAKLMPVLSRDPKNPYFLNLMAFLKMKSGSPKEGMLVLQLAQKSPAGQGELGGVLAINEALVDVHTGETVRGIARLLSLQEKNAMAALLVGYYGIKTYNFYWARATFYRISSGSRQEEDALWQALGEGMSKWGTFDTEGALKSLSQVTGANHRSIRLVALPMAAAVVLSDPSTRDRDQAKAYLTDYAQLQDVYRRRRDWVDHIRAQL